MGVNTPPKLAITIPAIYGTPRDSIEKKTLGKKIVDGRVITITATMMCHGNFLPYRINKEGNKELVYLGNIFLQEPSELEKMLAGLSFDAVNKYGMARYELMTLASIKPNSIIVTKKGNNVIGVYIVKDYKTYQAYIPADRYINDFAEIKNGEKVGFPAFEEFCVEVEKVGEIAINKDLYKKLATPRAITRFKDEDIISKLRELINPLLEAYMRRDNS